MKMRNAAVVAALLLGALGCATTSAGPDVGPQIRGLQIQVENETYANLRVFALISSNEVPLGRVDALQTRALRLPRGVGGSMQLVARVNSLGGAGTGHTSEPFTLSVGQRMVWKLRESPAAAQAPRISSVHVFQCDSDLDC
jgi:hypothetical protein